MTFQLFYLISNKEFNNEADKNRQEFCIEYFKTTAFVMTSSIGSFLIVFATLSVLHGEIDLYLRPYREVIKVIVLVVQVATIFVIMPYCVLLSFQLISDGVNLNSELSEFELMHSKSIFIQIFSTLFTFMSFI